MEVEKIINWLQNIPKYPPTKLDLYFTEPYLEFHYFNGNDGNQILRINWFQSPSKMVGWDGGISMDFPVIRINFDEIIEDLQSQLAKYPLRAARR